MSGCRLWTSPLCPVLQDMAGARVDGRVCDGVESAALPTPLTGIVRNGGRDNMNLGPGKMLLRDANADAQRSGEMGIIGMDG